MNKEEALVTVIIPCYNSNKYITTCIDCLHNQSYKNWEAVFINDGSTDDTLKIINKYVCDDSRIKVYSQENQGAAKARETGITKASGSYLIFLDVDDTLNSNALELMINAFSNNIDIVVSGFNIILQRKKIGYKQLNNKILTSADYLKSVLCGKYGWELCAKMYRKRLFDTSIRTPTNIRIGEDAAVFIQLVCKANQIRIISDTVYNYIQYNQSASHIKSLKYAEETLQAAFFIEDLLKRTPFYEQIKKHIDTMALLFYSNSTRKGYLAKQHPLIRRMKEEHFKISALSKIPIKKAVYITLCYYFNLNKYI